MNTNVKNVARFPLWVVMVAFMLGATGALTGAVSGMNAIEKGRATFTKEAAQLIAGEIVYTDGDDYPAMCADKNGSVARIRYDPVTEMTTVLVTSCTLIFHGGFEEQP